MRILSWLSVAVLLAGCGHFSAASFKGAPVLPVQAAPDFTLTDQHGKPWTLSQQHGKVVAVFFGYTHCQDTCPIVLAKLAQAVRSQGSHASEITVAFVTVDPERDTPAVLATYVSHFDPSHIVGLTGTRAQIDATEHAYHVWAQKIPGKHSGDDYDDAHSSTVFLLDKNGNERVVHDQDDPVQALSADLKTLL